MNTVINVIPDFEHPLSLHNLEYEEVRDPESGASQYVLINTENVDIRWATAHVEERSLDEAAKIAAKTATVLFEMGMDVEEDEREQEVWFKKNPTKKSKHDVNRIPDGTPPAEILKIIAQRVRDNVLFNTARKYEMHTCCYKSVLNEYGAPEEVPIFDFDLQIADKIIGGRAARKNSVSNKYGLKPELSEKMAHNVPIPPHDLYTSKVALKLAALLTEYDKQVVQDAAQLRTYITNKLIEISSCGNTRDELRALELLGKVSDIGLFVEKSEVNVVHSTPAALEHAIKDRINRLLGYKNLEIEDAQYANSESLAPPIAIADVVRAAIHPEDGGDVYEAEDEEESQGESE